MYTQNEFKHAKKIFFQKYKNLIILTDGKTTGVTAFVILESA